STGTPATWCGRTSIRPDSSGTSATGSTTWTARTRSCRRATAGPGGWGRTWRGRTRGAAGTSCPPATATCRGKRASGCSARSVTRDRSRSSGRTPEWTGCVARPRRCSTYVRGSSNPRRPPSTQPSARGSSGSSHPRGLDGAEVTSHLDGEEHDMCYGNDGHGALRRSLAARGIDRRRFLLASMAAGGAVAVGAGAAVPAHADARPGRQPGRPGGRPVPPGLISIQLYTVREALGGEPGFDATLRAIAEFGYPKVEQAGYYGRTAQQLKAFYDEIGVTCTSR